jgi:hypothetical protein
MAFSKKTIFSISLIVAGLMLGLFVLLAYSMSGGKTSITLIFLALSVLSISAGTVLAFSRLLDKAASPVIDEINEDLKDDIEDLKQHRLTKPIWMMILVILGLLVFSFFVFRFHKMEAAWGSIPVIVPTFFGLLAVAWFIPHTHWYQESNSYTPMWIFMIPTIGFIITLGVGLARTENFSLLTSGSSELVQYNAIRAVGPILQETSGIGNVGLELDLPKCDGDECAVMLVIGLIILVFVLIIGSATIPHFWLLSGSIMLGIMLIIAIHDLRIRPHANYYPKEGTKTGKPTEQPVSSDDKPPDLPNSLLFPSLGNNSENSDKDY